MLYTLLFVLEQEAARIDDWDERVYVSEVAVHKVVGDARTG